MTKQDAIEYGVKIMDVFPDDISVKEILWVLRNLLESAQQAVSPDAELCGFCGQDENADHNRCLRILSTRR